jgi:actin-related protein 8
LSGGSAKLAGLIDELEESLIEYLPRFMSDIELVDVLAPKESDYSYLSWKGASIMAQVEGFKPCFLHQAEWQNSGINALKSKLPFLW